MNRYEDFVQDELNGMQLPAQPLTEEEKARILARSLQKAGLSGNEQDAKAAGQPRGRAVVMPRRRRASRRAVRILAAAAAVCALSVTAAAVGPLLLKMARGEVAFFGKAKSQEEVSSAADAPRGSYEASAQIIEAYNAPVGQSAQVTGWAADGSELPMTMTLDTVSMDCAVVNLFMTYRAEDLVERLTDAEDYSPEWAQMEFSLPFLWVRVNGEECDSLMSDSYRVDGDTISVWMQYAQPCTPAGEEVLLEVLNTDGMNGLSDGMRLSVTLDGDSVRAGGRQIEPGSYDLHQEVFNDAEMAAYGIPEEENTALETVVKNLAFGPAGGVMVLDGSYRNLDTEQGTFSLPTTFCNVAVSDDAGNWLIQSRSRVYGSSGGLSVALTAPDAAAKSLTLTPYIHPGSYENDGSEKRTVTVEEMKQGVEIHTSDIGGFTVQNYRVEGSSITYEMVPFGAYSGNAEMIADDEGMIDMVESQVSDLDDPSVTYTAYHSALVSETLDPATGVIRCRIDYYAATEEQLQQISSFHYYYEGGWQLDTENALTLPLTAVE